MTKESAADIIRYLDIIDGNLPNEQLDEGTDIYLGTPTEGAEVGNFYIFDSGSRWARITEEEGDHWLMEYGLLEYDADNIEYVSKHDMSSMIKNNEMIFQEELLTDILSESLDEDDGFNKFIDGVDRYLLVNYMKESTNFDYPWKVAWAEDKIPSEAAEEAILLED